MRQIQSGGCEACSNFQVLVTQSFPILWDPRDFSPSGSSVHGILQVRILEWVAIPFCQGIFLTQQSTPHLLQSISWQVDSIPLGLPGKANVWEP